nr:uncharacterized protein LOC124496952 [Dermatophagoides farinae]
MSRRSSTISDSSTSGISINSSSLSSSSSSSSSSSTQCSKPPPIFVIYQPAQRLEPCPRRHHNLDTKRLTFRQNVHLARLHYLRQNNVWRLMFIGCCVPFFFITSNKVWIEYVTHKTVVNMEFLTPTLVNIPSITLCVRLKLNGFDENMDYFLDTDLNLHHQNHNGSLTINSLALSQVVEQCKLFSNTIIIVNESMPVFDCESIAPVVTSFQYGHKCFTYFSDIYGHLSRLPLDKRPFLEYDMFPSVQIILSPQLMRKKNGTKFSFVMDHIDKNRSNASSLFAMIHDNKNLPSMLENSIRFVLPDNSMAIFYGEKIEQLKPSPFDTNCFEGYDYTLDDKLVNWNGQLAPLPNGFRSSGECFVHCLSGHLNEECINYYSLLTDQWIRRWLQYNHTRMMPFCSLKHMACQHFGYWKQLDDCTRKCRPSCLRRWFTMTKVNSEPYNQTSITLFRSNEPSQLIEHVEATSLETFLGNIGGHLHVWLGISVVEIFNYIIRVIRLRQFSGILCCLYILFKRSRNP